MVETELWPSSFSKVYAVRELENRSFTILKRFFLGATVILGIVFCLVIALVSSGVLTPDHILYAMSAGMFIIPVSMYVTDIVGENRKLLEVAESLAFFQDNPEFRGYLDTLREHGEVRTISCLERDELMRIRNLMREKEAWKEYIEMYAGTTTM